MSKRTKRANTLSDDGVKDLLVYVVKASRRPVVDRAVFALSFLAGLRVQEIAGLRWDDHVFNAQGDWDMRPIKTGSRTVKKPFIYISGSIGKAGRDRTMRVHDQLFEALQALYADPSRDPSNPYVIPSGRRGAEQAVKPRASALKMRINRMYAAMGLNGCSSHTGRRTFITKLSRIMGDAHCSLRDVQHLAGHADIKTTEGYIDTSDNQSALIDLLG